MKYLKHFMGAVFGTAFAVSVQASWVYPPQAVDWTVSGNALETVENLVDRSVGVGCGSTEGSSCSDIKPFRLDWDQTITLSMTNCVGSWCSLSIYKGSSYPYQTTGISVHRTGTWNYSLPAGGDYVLYAYAAEDQGAAGGWVKYREKETVTYGVSAADSGIFEVHRDTVSESFVSSGDTAYGLVFKRPDGTVADGTLSSVNTSHSTANPDVILGRTGTTSGGLSAVITKTVFVNDPPSVPVYLSTSSQLGRHSLDEPVELSWGPSSDPNNDSVSYQVFLGTAPEILSLVQEGTATSYRALATAFDRPYYWRAVSVDAPGASSPGPITSFQVSFTNQPPRSFTALSGTGTQLMRGTSVQFSWEAAGDPDGDAVSYTFSLGTDPGAVESGSNEVRLSTNSFTLSGLSYGTTYYWKAAALDAYGGSTLISGGIQSYLPLFGNSPPVPEGTVAEEELPSGDIPSRGDSLRVAWRSYTDPDGDPVRYTLYAGENALSPVYQGQANSFLLTGLKLNVPYLYRVEAEDSHGAVTEAASASFRLVAQAAQADPYNYPNPFRIGQGTNFVFTSASEVSGLKIEVYSVYQNLVWKKELGPLSAGVHQIPWDGRDLNGRKIFSGLYVAVFESPQGRKTTRLVGVR